jgi:hypothetical protein
MPTPPTAVEWLDPMDPSEEMDWIADLSPMLEDGEAVEPLSYTVALSPEAIDAGLLMMSGSGRDQHLLDDGRAILFWLNVEAGSQADPIFDGAGTRFPIEFTFTTNSVPSRKRQRTYVLRVAQR